MKTTDHLANLIETEADEIAVRERLEQNLELLGWLPFIFGRPDRVEAIQAEVRADVARLQEYRERQKDGAALQTLFAFADRIGATV